MTERKIMSRAEVFDVVARLGGACLAGKLSPQSTFRDALVRHGDWVDAMHAFLRTAAERFDRVPAEVSDDIAIQEAIRHQLDGAMSKAVMRLSEMGDQLGGASGDA